MLLSPKGQTTQNQSITVLLLPPPLCQLRVTGWLHAWLIDDGLVDLELKSVTRQDACPDSYDIASVCLRQTDNGVINESTGKDAQVDVNFRRKQFTAELAQ
eukprot:5998956-Amphidinium_carterae.1